jgi:hypothetical protein
MDLDRASARAREEAQRFLNALNLEAEEREIVHELYVSLLGAVNRNQKFWEQVEQGSINAEVIPSAAAMLTAYTDELVRALRGDPRHG